MVDTIKMSVFIILSDRGRPLSPKVTTMLEEVYVKLFRNDKIGFRSGNRCGMSNGEYRIAMHVG